MSQSILPSPPRASFESSRTFAWLILSPGKDRAQAAAIVVSLVCLIGWLDYLTGVMASLQLFYLAPIIVAVARFGSRAARAVCVACIVLRIAGDYASDPAFIHEHLRTILWNRVADLFVYFLMVGILHTLISLHRDLEQRVRQRTADLEQAVADRDTLQIQLSEVSRRERSTIGRELHDGLGQHLTATSIAADLVAVKLSAQGNEAAASARTVVRLIQEAIAKTRLIARGLLLSAIEPGELTAELEALAEHLARDYSVPCRFSTNESLPVLDDASASHLYYIAQEAARNALIHGKPTRLEISLFTTSDCVVLAIEDDGVGLPVDGARRKGMGLRIMEHRAQLIGGSFSIEPAPGAGTLVRCTFPLSRPAPDV
jgi:signal transduction histidine kinase